MYQNYHKHTSYSNIFTPDSAVMPEDYAKRAIELGHKILCSVEHGYQGNYYEVYDIAKKYNLKFVFGVEAYWVKDRFEKDKTNAHIIILAKNELGRRDINRVLSDANIEGYYFKPRLDLELLLSLNPDNVFITTACIGFFQYQDIKDIVLKLHNHFKSNFLLEVQYHNTESQKILNKKIISVSEKYGIDIIMGCDSHYIYPSQEQERLDLLESKGIRYENEDGWFMDYPNDEDAYNRFIKQGILNNEQIKKAMDNTNLILSFEDIAFNKDIKLPTLYPNLTQKEKDRLYIDIIKKEWKEFSKNIPTELHNYYKQEIEKEVKVIINTKMSDYFLLDYEIVKKAKEKGGLITATSRGSGSSFFTNTLLGFSKIDRISSPVKLYPERFISESRIIETKSLPDLDLNCGNPEIFDEAQMELLGENHSYPMIAYGTLRKLASFKMYAKSQNIPFDISNVISNQIKKFEEDYKYADDDEKDLINVFDYVEKEYHQILKDSEKYLGVISDKKSAPCAFLIYSGDIKEEIGLLKCKTESTGREVIVCVLDGATAEKYKFLKNDLLKVDVVLLIDLVYKRIGIPQHDILELTKITKDNQKAWDIYKNGLTVCINQVEKLSTTKKVMRYSPSNISELTAFVAAIRPSFESMYSIFESRQPFDYDIKTFDKLIQTEEMSSSFVLYQEMTMHTLQYAGFPSDETYSIIKAIAKKHPEIVKPLKEQFIKGFSEKIIEDEKISLEDALEKSDRVWKIIEDSAGYGFNASHALCVAYDSLYGAYLKSHYPLQFYEVVLNLYSDKGKKDKVSLIKKEMTEKMGINIGELKFGNDNRRFVIDFEKNQINQSLLSVKSLNKNVGESLYNLYKEKKYHNFLDLLIDIKEKTGLDKGDMEILITLNYFIDFGENKKILDFYNYFREFYQSKQINKEKFKRYNIPEEVIIKNSTQTEKLYKNIDWKSILEGIWNSLENKKISIPIQIKTEMEFLGYINYKESNINDNYYICIDKKVYRDELKPTLALYNLKTGKLNAMRITDSRLFGERKIDNFDIIKSDKIEEKNKKKKIDDKWIEIDEKYLILNSWNILKKYKE